MVKPNFTLVNQFNFVAPKKYERYLPSAFDSSLSMLEKLNKTIEIINMLGLDFDEIVELWNEIMEWLMGEGLEEEVREQLEIWLNDGTLASIINEEIFTDLNNQIRDVFVTPQMFGAIGDNMADDTQAIIDMVVYAKANNKSILFPKVVDGYKTTNTIHIDFKTYLRMDSPILLHGTANKTVLKIGLDYDNIHNFHGIVQAKHYYDPATSNGVRNWQDENSIAIQLINLHTCFLNVIEASDCTIGLQCIGDGRGFSYSNFVIGRIYNNKYGIDLRTDNGGYCTQLHFLGGRYSAFSGINLSQSRYGVRTLKNTVNDSNFGALTFEKPCIELNGVDVTAECIPFLLNNVRRSSFKEIRTERNGSNNPLSRLDYCEDCTFDCQVAITSGTNLEELNPYSENETIFVDRVVTNKTNRYYEIPIVNFDNLNSKLEYHPNSFVSERVIMNGLLGVLLNTTSFTMNNLRNHFNYSGVHNIIQGRGVSLPDTYTSQNFGFGINCQTWRKFKLQKDGTARLAILCFDASDNYLEPTSVSNYVKGSYFKLFTSDNHFSIYMQEEGGINNYKEMFFEVSNEVDKFILLVVPCNTGTILNNISLLGVYNDRIPGSGMATLWKPINVDFDYFPYAGRVPDRNTYNIGKPVWNDFSEGDTSVSQWRCTVAGTPGTWVGY